MRLIIGLGNPGSEYERTRHNIGWRVLDACKLDWTMNKHLQGWLAKQDAVLYLKPTTYMNESGRAVQAVMQFYKLTPADICVVYDDKDIPFETLRFRSKGSSGGHNGMKSIIAYLGTENFARLRLGIAPTDATKIVGDTAKYVLRKFTKAEEKQLPDVIDRAKYQLAEWAYNA